MVVGCGMLWGASADAEEPRALRERRGPYLSGLVGAGFVFAQEDYTIANGAIEGAENWNGAGARTRLLFGGTIARGLVLGIEFGGFIGAGRYTDDVRGEDSVLEENGLILGPVMQLCLQPLLPQNLFVRLGVGGNYLQHVRAGSGAGGVGGSLTVGWLKPIAPSFHLGVSAGVYGYTIGDDAEGDDGNESGGFGSVPSINLEAVAF